MRKNHVIPYNSPAQTAINPGGRFCSMEPHREQRARKIRFKSLFLLCPVEPNPSDSCLEQGERDTIGSLGAPRPARPGPQRVKPRAHNASRLQRRRRRAGPGRGRDRDRDWDWIRIGSGPGPGPAVVLRVVVRPCAPRAGARSARAPQPSPALSWRRSGPAPACHTGRCRGRARCGCQAGVVGRGISLPAASAVSAFFPCLESRGRRAWRNPAMF